MLLPLQTPETLPGPVGPAHWTLRNWLGVLLYLALFALAVYGIWRLARSVDDPDDPSPGGRPEGDGPDRGPRAPA